MNRYLTAILKAPPALRFLLLLGVGVALLWRLVELPEARFRLQSPDVSIPQETLGYGFLGLAAIIPIWGTYRGLRADWSRTLTGKLVASLSYDPDLVCEVVHEIGHPPHWTETPISCPTEDREKWVLDKRTSLEHLDKFFQEEIAKGFTYTKIDDMRTRLTIFLDATQNLHRWQSYSLSGMGEIEDHWGGTSLQAHVRIDAKHGLNVVSMQRARDLVKLLRGGLPILLVWDEQLRPLGELRAYPNYLYFTLRFSVLAGRWLLSNGLAYLDVHGAPSSHKVVVGYSKDLAIE